MPIVRKYGWLFLFYNERKVIWKLKLEVIQFKICLEKVKGILQMKNEKIYFYKVSNKKLR